MAERPTVLLSDASVLIDYRDANLSILTLASPHLGPLRAVYEVLQEVNGLDVQRASALGIEVVDVEPELLLEIDALPHRLSRQDRLSFLASQANDWICLTNDRLMRGMCAEHGLRLCWGLELMVRLVQGKALTAEIAIRTAKSVHENNPRHISAAVLEDFIDKVT